jgi:hypothetical protein
VLGGAGAPGSAGAPLPLADFLVEEADAVWAPLEGPARDPAAPATSASTAWTVASSAVSIGRRGAGRLGGV